jgi:predicted glycosyltransferase
LKIWLDISRQRHISFAVALTKVLNARGHSFCLTASQPAYLERLKSETATPDVTLIQTGRNLRNVLQLAVTPKRVLQLVNWARHQDIDMALSLDNPIQALAGRLLRLKVAALLENPHDQDAQVIRRAAHLLGLPTYLTNREVDRLKLKTTPIVWRYEDAPEASYFDGFKPSPATRIEFLQALGWGDHEDDEHLPIVVYHPKSKPESMRASEKNMQRLADHGALTVYLPSLAAKQSEREFKDRRLRQCPAQIDVRTLLSFADLVLSDGTTLIKEAALLETPCVWISRAEPQNRLGHLIEAGKVQQAIHLDSPLSMRPDRRKNPAQPVVSHLASELITQLESAFEILG